MAQVNIAFIAALPAREKQRFAQQCRDVVAKEVHGLQRSEIQPDSVTVLALSVDRQVSISGADIEVQVLVSGNNWPTTAAGQPANAAEAKAYFDVLAATIHKVLASQSQRTVYVWVTPFTASGWAI